MSKFVKGLQIAAALLFWSLVGLALVNEVQRFRFFRTELQFQKARKHAA